MKVTVSSGFCGTNGLPDRMVWWEIAKKVL